MDKWLHYKLSNNDFLSRILHRFFFFFFFFLLTKLPEMEVFFVISGFFFLFFFFFERRGNGKFAHFLSVCFPAVHHSISPNFFPTGIRPAAAPAHSFLLCLPWLD